MFTNNYISNQHGSNTSYLFNLIDSNDSAIVMKPIQKVNKHGNNTDIGDVKSISFEFDNPLKPTRIIYDTQTDRGLNSESISEFFSFIEPRKLNRSDFGFSTPSSTLELNHIVNNVSHQTAPGPVPSKHKIIVEQSPFSALKSIKSQEQSEKTNNVQIISSLRNHPYGNSKSRPTASNKTSEPITVALATSESLNNEPLLKNDDLTSEPVSLLKPIESSTRPTETDTMKLIGQANSSSKRPQPNVNRNSSSNAILAHLRSISPNFKSIFVRPRNCKLIDSSSILNKNKLHYKNVSSQHETSLLPLLYSNNKQQGQSNSQSLFNMMHNIEPKEIRLNSSVDDLLKKFANENGVISKTLKNLSTCSSSVSSSTLNSITPSGSNRERTASGTSSIRSALNQTNISTPVPASNTQQHGTTSMTEQLSPTSYVKEKWTCMVCLSKHSIKQDICSICGSEKPASKILQHSQASYNIFANSLLDKSRSVSKQKLSAGQPISPSNELFSSYLINELGLKHKLDGQADKDVKSSTSSVSALLPKVNPYLKKWTCIQCNFSNDSLKIVCLNCRWIKTSPKPSVPKPDDIETDSAKESKKAKPTEASLFVETSATPVCASCKSPIVAEEVEKTQTSASNGEPNKEIFSTKTPEKTTAESSSSIASTKYVAALPTSTVPAPATETNSIFKKANTQGAKKWTCDVCLVSNAEANDKCACCMTAKPSKNVAPQSKPEEPTVPNNLFSKLGAKSGSSKWTCDSCLVSNEADKEKCVCCQADKPSTSQTDKSAAPSNTLSLPKSDIFQAKPSSTIKFGAAEGSSIKMGSNPITFGASNFSVFPTEKTTSDSTSAPFSFGSSSSLSKTSDLSQVAGEAKKPQFSFVPLNASTDSIPQKKEIGAKASENTNPVSSLSTSSFLSTLNSLAGPVKSSSEATTPFKFGDATKKSDESTPPFKFGETKSTKAASKFGESTLSTIKFGESTSVTAPKFGESTSVAAPKFGESTSVAAPKFGESTSVTAPKFGESTSSTVKFGESTSTTAPKFGEATAKTTPFSFGSLSSFPSFGACGENSIKTSSQQPAQSFSPFASTQKSAESKQPENASTSNFGTTSFGTLLKESTTSKTPASSSTPASGSFFQLSTSSLQTNDATKSITPTMNLFGESKPTETPKLSFGNLPSSSSSQNLFGKSSAQSEKPMFGGASSGAGLFPASNQQQQASGSSSFSFSSFPTPPSSTTSTAGPTATPTTSLFSTQTLTPATNAQTQPSSTDMQMNSNNFQFTPLAFNNTPQQTPKIGTESNKFNFVPNLHLNAPVINFTSTNPSGFVFSGGSDQQTTQISEASQRRRAKAVRRTQR